MKRFIGFAILFPTLAIAAGAMKRDANKVPLTGIAPTVFGIYSTTKASRAIDTTNYSRVKVYPVTANDVTVKINGAGVAWPLTKNTMQDYSIPPGVTSLVFYVVSTASTAKSKIYYQAEE